jgi:hypothetical protein
MLQSKGKETMRSRQKILKTEQDEDEKRNVYYGYTKNSRSKSRRSTLDRKGSKKTLGLKQGLTFDNKKLKH